MVISVDMRTGEILDVRESSSACNDDVLYDQFAHRTADLWAGLCENTKKPADMVQSVD